jgi:hypothetical protein
MVSSWRGMAGAAHPEASYTSADRERNLNNPISRQVNNFFLEALGVDEISRGWSWSGIEADEAARQLDEYVNLRHQIAHRARLSKDTPKKRPRALST